MKKLLGVAGGLMLAASLVATARGADHVFLNIVQPQMGTLGSSHGAGTAGWVVVNEVTGLDPKTSVATERAGNGDAWGASRAATEPKMTSLVVTVGAAEAHFIGICQQQMADHKVLGEVAVKVMRPGSDGKLATAVTYRFRDVRITAVNGGSSGQGGGLGASSNAWGTSSSSHEASGSGAEIRIIYQEMQVINGSQGGTSGSPAQSGWDLQQGQKV